LGESRYFIEKREDGQKTRQLSRWPKFSNWLFIYELGEFVIVEGMIYSFDIVSEQDPKFESMYVWVLLI
jgi:hypothetical protein